MKTTRKIILPLVSVAALLILAGCASHNDPSAVGAAPGVTPPATIAPPPPPSPPSAGKVQPAKQAQPMQAEH